MMKEVLVVGAGLAGLETARQLRQQGFDGGITIVGDESHFPYDRPQLSKDLLCDDGAPVHLVDEVSLAAIDVEIRVAERAVAADLARRVVVMAGGDEYPYESLVIASGSRARRLPGVLSGALTLRTIDDALLLRERLAMCRSIAIVGAGFLGLEVASASRKLGLSATLIGRDRQPLNERVGPTVRRYCESLADAAGVDMAFGQSIVDARIDVTGRTRLWLASGRVVDAEFVVAATGADPNTEWLRDSGLELDPAVACDAYLRAKPSVYAVGDVASWLPVGSDTRLRSGHRQNAVQQAATVAHNILHPHALRPHEAIPYFWSDMFGAKVQFVGEHPTHGSEQLVGAPDGGRFAIVHSQGGSFVGASIVNAPAVTAVCLRALADRTPIDSAIEQIERRILKKVA